MTGVVVGSISGSPGATRLAVGLAAAWPDERRRTLIEADADGGRLGAQLGVGVEPGLMALALAARNARLNTDDVLELGAARVGEWHLVPAPASAEQAHAALVHAGPALAETMAAGEDDVWIVDAGRLSVRSPALAFGRRADHVLLMTSGSFPALQLVPHRVDSLARAGCPVSVVVVEPTWWSPAEIASFVGADVAAVVPAVRSRDDSIRAMQSGAWRSWWRVVERLAAHTFGRGDHDDVAHTRDAEDVDHDEPAGSEVLDEVRR